MARIDPLPIEQTPAETLTAYQHHVDEYQARITNMKATLGHSKLAFEVYMQWYPLYDRVKAILGQRLAYLFAYSISSGSNCPLCSTFFRKIIIDHGESVENLTLTEQEQLILDFGTAIAKHQGHLKGDLFDAIRQTFTLPELVELIAFAGQMIATNVFNNVLETDLDEYLLAYLPTPQ
ncbi:MAG: hypothetical protein QM669_06045 [Siphonobacter sp.]